LTVISNSRKRKSPAECLFQPGFIIREIIMGILDKVVSILGNQAPDGSAQSSLFEHVIGMLNNPEIGGLPGLISKFEKGGLG